MKRTRERTPPDISPLPSDWRGKVTELLPELGRVIAEAENPMALWDDIHFTFLKAYEEPRNDDLIRRVYAFAEWSVKQMKGRQLGPDDLSTAATVCFYEELPVKLAVRDDMPRWLTRSQIVEKESVFRYFLDERGWQELLALWTPRPRHPAKPKRRSR